MKKTKIVKLISLCLLLLLINGCTNRQIGALVKEGDTEGMMLQNGDIVVKPKFDRINRFDGDLEKYSHANLVNLHWIHYNSDEPYAVVKNFKGKYGIIDKNGKQLLDIKYDSIEYFKNGFAKIKLNKKFGLIDKDFKIVLKPKYDEIKDFTGNTTVIKENNKYGCIDKDMNLKIKPQYDMIYMEYEGMRRVQLRDKWGFANEDCNIVTKPKFEYANNFFDSYAKVKLNNKWGYINKEGNYISKEIFDSAENFN